MTIGSLLSDTLRALAPLLGETEDPWWIIAGAAAALLTNSSKAVADVDILLSVDDARRLLPAAGIKVAGGPTSNQFRSVAFGRWEQASLPVEFMAGFHHFENDRWVPVRPITRKAISVDTTTVFVPELSELIPMCERFGRRKDLERAILLRAYL